MQKAIGIGLVLGQWLDTQFCSTFYSQYSWLTLIVRHVILHITPF